MAQRYAALLVAVLVVLEVAGAEDDAHEQLRRRLPDLSWSRLTALQRLVESSRGHLTAEDMLRQTGTLQLYRELPEAGPDIDTLNLLIGLILGPYITPLAAREDISPLCRKHSWAYVTNILNIHNLWALKMFDSTGKLPDGILTGNTNAVGVWDECLGVQAVIDGIQTEENIFRGKHCRPQFQLPSNASNESQGPAGFESGRRMGGLGLEPILPPVIHASGHSALGQLTSSIGLCIPSSCSAEELRLGLQKKMPDLEVVLEDRDCHVMDQKTNFGAGDIVVITILCIVGVLMVTGTFIDVVKDNAKEADANISAIVDRKFRGRLPITLQKVLLAFSVWTNGRKLLDTSKSSDTLGCLHGIRFLSMTWVVLGHQYVFGLGAIPWANEFYIFKVFNSLAFAAVDNATVSVDSFFFLSGLLVAYIFMRNMERSEGKFNIVMYYVHRYVRLTPVLAMVMAFVATLYIDLGEGPFWGHSTDRSTSYCTKYWWKNVLYINNLYESDLACLPQTWYLANDMQMFIASPLVLLPLFFYPTIGQIWLVLLLALNMLVTGYVTAYNDLGPLDNTPDSTKLRYFVPWCRYGAYLVGVYTGWFLHQRRRRRLQLSLPAVLAGWLTAALVACLIVYGMYDYSTVPPLAEASRSVAVVYGALNRPVWAMCLAWLVIACVHGYGGFIDSLLSWRLWIPLSRLTYCCYLVSIDTQVFFYASLKSVLYFDQTNAVYQFLATLCSTVAVAAAFSLAFESPMLSIEKIIFANVGAAAPKKAASEPAATHEQQQQQAELPSKSED